MPTRTLTPTIQPPGQSIGIDGYGATVVNRSSTSIYVEGKLLTPGSSASVPEGDRFVNIDCSVPALVEITYGVLSDAEEAAFSVTIAAPIQIGPATRLSLFRLISSIARTYGITYEGAEGEGVGLSYELTVNAPGGAPVVFPSIPEGAITASIVPPPNVSESSTIYYVASSDPDKIADFQAHPTRYPRKLVPSTGTRMGA